MNNKFKPAEILIFSYGAVGLLGTLLLMLPGAATGQTSFLQAWFTAVSALTVTGLTVVPTASHWTMFGQTVLLILMQIGGLGLMVFTTIFFMALGLRIQLAHRALIVQDRNTFSMAGILRLVKSIIILTLIIEGVGALLMAFLTPNLWDKGIGEGLFFVIFQSVSAFNGVGLDVTGQSLIIYRSYPALLCVYMVLIFLGSLGYVVLQEILVLRKWRRMSLHSRLVFWVTGMIIFIGTIFYFFSEYQRLLADLDLPGKIVESLFQAVTRTAGFTTVAVNNWTEPFIFLMIMMMFIGASPGSVGGGIKTTTVGTIILAIWAIARGRKEVVLWEREIAPESVTKAFTVAVIAMLLVSFSTLLIMVIEKLPFMPVLFEVVSALATVGLSMGITGELSPFGQILLTILMFIGRIGVLSLVIFLTKQEQRRLRYLKEDILIG